MSAKHIAYLVSEYPAPSHTFIRREVDALRAGGTNITTFSIRRPDSTAKFSPPDQDALNSTIYLLPAKVGPFLSAHIRALALRPLAYAATLRLSLQHRAPGFRSLIWSFFYFAEAIVLASKLQAAEISHIHNHFANASATVGLLASTYLCLPWSLTLHGSADWAYPAGILLPEKISAATFVACVSQYGRAQAYRICPIAQWEKLFIAHCGIDFQILPPRARALNATGTIHIITVGRLSPEKGQLGLVRAFSNLLKRGVDAKLQIIGEGPIRAALETLIADLCLQDHCILSGQKSENEVLEALAVSDLFVLSSFMEGLPVVLMEALGMRVPVIAPCVAGIPELVQHEVTGLLFAPGDWDALADQMERAARDTAFLERTAELGHRLVEREFEIHRSVEPMAQHFLYDVTSLAIRS